MAKILHDEIVRPNRIKQYAVAFAVAVAGGAGGWKLYDHFLGDPLRNHNPVRVVANQVEIGGKKYSDPFTFIKDLPVQSDENKTQPIVVKPPTLAPVVAKIEQPITLADCIQKYSAAGNMNDLAVVFRAIRRDMHSDKTEIDHPQNNISNFSYINAELNRSAAGAFREMAIGRKYYDQINNYNYPSLSKLYDMSDFWYTTGFEVDQYWDEDISEPEKTKRQVLNLNISEEKSFKATGVGLTQQNITSSIYHELTTPPQRMADRDIFASVMLNIMNDHRPKSQWSDHEIKERLDFLGAYYFFMVTYYNSADDQYFEKVFENSPEFRANYHRKDYKMPLDSLVVSYSIDIANEQKTRQNRRRASQSGPEEIKSSPIAGLGISCPLLR